MKILYIGSSGPLSTLPLISILQSQHSICSIAMDLNQTNSFYNHLFPVKITNKNTPDIHLDTFARQHNLPVIVFNSELENYARDIEHYKPDIILVSCFGKKLPANILSIPRYGCFNLHPSLLPSFKGPMPIFWQFREGANQFGVTLHQMTEDFDAGNIIKQASIQLDNGITHQQAKLQLAHLAADLIKNILDDFTHAIDKAIPQDKQLGSYHTYPTREDYRVSTIWPARRIFNFVKAYQGGNTMFPCDINGQAFNLVEAVSFKSNQRDEFKLIHDQITFSCSEGSLTATVRSDNTS